MEEELRESDPSKMKYLDPKSCEEVENAAKIEETSSSGTSEKNEGSPRVTWSDESSQPSGAPSVSGERSESTSSFDGEKLEAKGAFSKWESPPKTQEPAVVPGSLEEPEKETCPDPQKIRPATIAIGGTASASNKTSVKKRFLKWLKSPLSHKSEQATLLQPDANSRVTKGGPSTQGGSESQPAACGRPPMYAEFTGQEGRFLHGLMTVYKDSSFEESITDTTSLSCSISLDDKKESTKPSDPECHVDSREGSTGDASSLEREFEELSSPSKSAQQGLKRNKTSNEMDNEEEGKATAELCASPKKRADVEDPDPVEDKPKDSEMTD